MQIHTLEKWNNKRLNRELKCSAVKTKIMTQVWKTEMLYFQRKLSKFSEFLFTENDLNDWEEFDRITEQPDLPYNWCNRRFNSQHTRVRDWVERGEGGGRQGGREVMFAAAWRELAPRERKMIWSRADSWDHNARLPAAAWQTEGGGESDTERLLQTASTPSSLLIISNWASGSN